MDFIKRPMVFEYNLDIEDFMTEVKNENVATMPLLTY